MTWIGLAESLRTQITERFPVGDIGAWRGELPMEWLEAESFFRAEEERARSVVACALHRFIGFDGWPGDLTLREKVWLNARLRLARQTALRLAVPFPECAREIEPPADACEKEIMVWLLFTLWEAFGLAEWLLEVRSTWTALRWSQRQSLN